MASRKKNSLVANINRRKRTGKSRSKAKSTVSKEAYEDMQKGWPGRGGRSGGKKKKSGAKRKSAKGKTAHGKSIKGKTRSKRAMPSGL